MKLDELLKEAIPNPRYFQHNKDKLLVIVNTTGREEGLIEECLDKEIDCFLRPNQKNPIQVYQRIYPK